jgi:regulator of sigma E protease
VGIFFLMFQIFGIQLIKPVVRAVSENSPAQRAGIEKNDRIIAVNGVAIESWGDIDEIITSGKGEKLAVSVQRGDLNFVKDILPELTTGKNIFGEDVDYYDIGASGLPVLKPVVGGVLDGAPAEKGGLKQGDLIKAINGTSVQTWNQMKEIIDSSKGQNLEISVLRNSSTLVFNIIPEHKTEKNSLGEKVDSYRIGISTPGLASSGAVFTKKLNPFNALWESLVKTYELSKLIVVGIVKMFQGAISPKELGGPIIIAKMAGDQARQGAISFIFFIAFLSINLAILNFLPIPVLDGGHLLFFGIEAVIGRPVNTRVREVAMQIGLLILLSLMVFVFYNDTMRFKDVIIEFFNNSLQFFKGMMPG